MAFNTAHDIVPDSPTNNHCTWNKLAGRNKNSTNPFLQPTFSEGNTKIVAHASEVTHAIGTIASSGKHYAEFIVSGGTSVITGVGVISSEWNKFDLQSYIYNFGGAIYAAVGTLYSNTTSDTTPDAITTSFRVGIEVDFSANEVAFFKVESNGTKTQQGLTITSNIDFKNSGTFAASLHNSSDYVEAYFNQDDWWGTPNAGYTALCTANLADPDIDPALDDLPEDYFRAVNYVGNVPSGNTTTSQNVDFEILADLLWIKDRNSGTNYNHGLFDSVRGFDKWIGSNTSSAQDNTANAYLSYVSGTTYNIGWSPSINSDTHKKIAWCWKAGGAPTADNTATSGAMNANGSTATSSNSSVSIDGVLQSNYTPAGSPTIYPKRMSVNTKAGFSIVKYAGITASNVQDTIPHGLNNTPEFIIIKDLANATNWRVYHKDITVNETLYLNLTDADAAGADIIYSPNTNTITLGNGTSDGGGVARNNTAHICYAWHSVAGYSAFGSYIGNGSADGPFVECGFRPAWVMCKCTTVSSNNWVIRDSVREGYNSNNKALFPNTFDQETGSTWNPIDILSNGFKIRATGTDVNSTSQTYIFAAFAEQPFKYANAR